MIDLSVFLGGSTAGCVDIDVSLVFFTVTFSIEVLSHWIAEEDISPLGLDMDFVIELWVDYELKDDM